MPGPAPQHKRCRHPHRDDDDDKDTAMTLHYSNPALDAELAYRREVLMAAGRGTRTKRGAWFRNRRRPR
jgi:hypothetical protein